MLEEFIIQAAAERLRSGVFGPHVDCFCSRLAEAGYTRATITTKLWTIGALARWMADHGLGATDLDEARVDDFFAARRARGRLSHGDRRTATMLLAHLRSSGAVATPQPSRDTSPFAPLLARYEVHLRQERALTEGTISEYGSMARALVCERLQEAGRSIQDLGAQDIHDYLLARVHRLVPKRAQFVTSALRSFLRFLFARGEIRTDLSVAVLTVRLRRSPALPRHMPPRDVERLLRSCDRSSATGRRNYAVLLLLARLGLRASEVVSLELDDLRWREGEIHIRGKGLVRDRLPLLPDVGEALALYLREDRPPTASRRVFLCRRAPSRGFSHPSTVSTIVARALAKAGLSPALRGAHLLRHSLATAMIRRGASLAEIGEVLRHRSANTTEIYAKVDFGTLKDIALPWPIRRGVR